MLRLISRPLYPNCNIRLVSAIHGGALQSRNLRHVQQRRFNAFPRNNRRESTAPLFATLAGFALATLGSISLLKSNDNLLWASDASEGILGDGLCDEETEPALRTSPNGFVHKSEGQVDYDGLLASLGSELSSNIIDANLWKNAGSFCPPENDKTGIARFDGANVATQSPPEDMIVASFMPLPTHSWAFFGVFDGERGASTSLYLSNVLLLAVAGALADLMQKYDTSGYSGTSQLLDDVDYSTTASSSDGDPGSSSGDYSMYSSTADMPMPFTPDIVRPMPPSPEIEQTIKDAFSRVDEGAVYENVQHFLKGVDDRNAENRASSTKEAGNVGWFGGKKTFNGRREGGFKEEAIHLLGEAQSGSGALVGFYESDTKIMRVALAGDSRALLGRPMPNPKYTPSPSATAPPPVSPPRRTSSPMSLWNSEKAQKKQKDAPALEPLKRSDYPILYEIQQLTQDQTPSNPAEVSRLKSLHPNKQLFFDASSTSTSTKSKQPARTYLGISTTRGFGYSALKWSLDVQQRLHRDFLGDEPPSFFLDGTLPSPSGIPPSELASSKTKASPAPYLTPEPEITTIKVQPGDFVVLGSKGLFECLSNEEVVGLVGAWVEERRRRHRGLGGGKTSIADLGAIVRDPASGSGSQNNVFGSGPSMRDPMSLVRVQEEKAAQQISELQERLKQDDGDRAGALSALIAAVNGAPPSNAAPQPPRLVSRSQLPILSGSVGGDDDGTFRYQKTWGTSKDSVMFITEDRDLENAAVHVIRNALGGADSDLCGALMGMMAPRAAKFRDDVSLQVVFFE